MLKLANCWDEKKLELNNPIAWVTIVVKNVCMDMHRQSSRYVAAEPAKVCEGNSACEDAFRLVDDAQPFDGLISQERYSIINKCLNKLPEAIQPVAVMRFRDMLNYREIASILGIQESTARKRVEYARKLLTRDREFLSCAQA